LVSDLQVVAGNTAPPDHAARSLEHASDWFAAAVRRAAAADGQGYAGNGSGVRSPGV